MTDTLDVSHSEALAVLPGETLRARTAFLDYVRMGSGRSLRKLFDWYHQGQMDGDSAVVEPPTSRLRTLEEWSAKFNWQARIDAYQKELERQEQQRWEERRRHIRESDWDLCERLREHVRQALEQMPQFLKTTRQYVKGRSGEPDREVVTIQQDLGALLKALEVVSKLQRLASDLPDSHLAISGTVVTTTDLAEVRAKVEQWERERFGTDASRAGPGA
jgi:hypothetical protein